MATMTFTLSAAGTNLTRDFTLPDADAPRMIAWAMAAYPNAEDDETPLTPDIALRRWLVGTLAGTMANVVRHEEEEAKKAVQAPAPIVIEAVL